MSMSGNDEKYEHKKTYLFCVIQGNVWMGKIENFNKWEMEQFLIGPIQ